MAARDGDLDGVVLASAGGAELVGGGGPGRRRPRGLPGRLAAPGPASRRTPARSGSSARASARCSSSSRWGWTTTRSPRGSTSRATPSSSTCGRSTGASACTTGSRRPACSPAPASSPPPDHGQLSKVRGPRGAGARAASRSHGRHAGRAARRGRAGAARGEVEEPARSCPGPVRRGVGATLCRSLYGAPLRKYLERRTRAVRGGPSDTRWGSMQVRLVLFVSALLAVFSLRAAAASASSLGDPAISSDHNFRLNAYTLEPGCFIPGRGPVDLDSHLDLTTLDQGQIARGLHITVDHNSPVNVDQVLVPSAIDGIASTTRSRTRVGLRTSARTSPRWTCSPRTRTASTAPIRSTSTT